MIERIEWEDAYRLWKDGCYEFPEILQAPVDAETVFVKYDVDDCYCICRAFACMLDM